MGVSSRYTKAYGPTEDETGHARTKPGAWIYTYARVTALSQWQNLVARLRFAVAQSVEYSRPNMFGVGLVMSIGFPLYYVFWVIVFPQSYENLPLRLLGAALGIPLLFVDQLPSRLRHYLPIYWLIVLIYSLPFFFTFMLLKNDVSVVWSMSTVAAAVLLILLVFDWLMLTLITFGGSGLAWICFYMTGGQLDQELVLYLTELPIYAFVLIAGSIFNYKTELVKQERLQAMATASRTVAHELRTPLLGIRSGIAGVNRYLPDLLQAYELARSHGLPVRHIRDAHYKELASVLQRVEAETQHSNMVIDMLLFNAQWQHIDTQNFNRISVSACIASALSRYPFKSDQERSIVSWQAEQDYVFYGCATLMEHVLLNLLKNALQSIGSAKKGDITIWVTQTGQNINLHFRDTGGGISAEKLPHIFDYFSTSMMSEHSVGIGLGFCKMVMKSFGGNIDCSSQLGEFTEFVLYFPEAKANETP